MNPKHISAQFEQLWQAGIERAVQDQTHVSELDKDSLNDAAGLQIKSGVQAGAWTGAGCSANCPTPTSGPCG